MGQILSIYWRDSCDVCTVVLMQQVSRAMLSDMKKRMKVSRMGMLREVAESELGAYLHDRNPVNRRLASEVCVSVPSSCEEGEDRG